MTQKKNRKKSGREKLKEPKILEKKNSRQLRGRGFPPPKKKSEDPSGSIRDITAYLLHDKNTSIAVSCTVFNFPSAGNDPGWIYWSYDFLMFRPRGLRTRTRRRHRPDPDVKIWRSKGLNPSYYVAFY